MSKIVKDKGKYIITSETTSEITVEEARKYNDNRGSLGAGLFVSVFCPLVLTGLFNYSSGHNVPDALSKQATAICLQEIYSKTSPNDNELVNLSTPEIETCVTNFKEQRAAGIKTFSLVTSGLFAAAGLGMATFGFASNMRLRSKKPGIKQAARAERIGLGLA